MSASEFDIGPLTWVKAEIEQALARAGAAIDAYVANPQDSTQLKFCKTHLHQAHGALEIVGLDGVTRLTEECERLIDAIEGGTVPMSAAAGRVLARAFETLTAYLGELAEGAPHQPVRLFPQYKAVLEARGAERILESDLFFPDLSLRPPRRELSELPSDMREYVVGQRRRFQAGLLRWLRNAADNAALREMTEAVRGIERTQAMAQHRAFWWVTIGFTESLVAVGAQASIEAKRLCARIDLQMKRLMEGSQNVAERLLRDTLYFVARSRVASPQVEEIRRVYALDGIIPVDDPHRRDIKPHEADLRALREIIASAKDKWNRFSAGHAHELTGFREQAAQMKERVARLGQPDLAMLMSAVSAVTMWIADNPSRVTESIALETATALLLAESAVENFARLSPEFPQQVLAMGARLQASLAGDTIDVPLPALDEMSRKAQERLVMAQVVVEIKSNLGAIESTLDGFFRDDSRRGELTALDAQMRQVAGALSMLGADRALEALSTCRAEIARFATGDYAPAQADFEQVAQLMSALGFYVEALQHGPADFDTMLRPVAPRRPRAVEEETAPQPVLAVAIDLELDTPAPAEPDGTGLSVEAELDQQRKDTRALYDAWRDKPGDKVLAEELKANLQSIQQDADIVDEPALQESAERALELLNLTSHGTPTLASIEQAMSRVAPEERPEEVIAPSDEVRALASASDEVVDAELLAIFLEEAAEVLGTIAEHESHLDADPARIESLTVIRRGFHTLKGSGRMVGLMRFGEAAWATEQVMNHWLQDPQPASPDLRAMIAAARQLFTRWVGDLARTGASHADATALIAACERLRTGGPFALAPAPGAASPVPPLPQVPVSSQSSAQAWPAPSAEADAPPDPRQAMTPEQLERSIVIGDMRVSPSLYSIFVDEAAVHLATLHAEQVLLETEPQPPRDELVRAAHTLAGIAGTVSFRRLHELARAFERALLVAKSAGIVPEGDDLRLLRLAVEAVDALVTSVRELREPAPQEPLEASLEALRAHWLAASGEIDPAMLQIESPPADDEDVPMAAPDGTGTAVAFLDDTARAEAGGAVDFDFSSVDADTGDGALPAVGLDLDFGDDTVAPGADDAPWVPGADAVLTPPANDPARETMADAEGAAVSPGPDDPTGEGAVAATYGGVDFDFGDQGPALPVGRATAPPRAAAGDAVENEVTAADTPVDFIVDSDGPTEGIPGADTLTVAAADGLADIDLSDGLGVEPEVAVGIDIDIGIGQDPAPATLSPDPDPALSSQLAGAAEAPDNRLDAGAAMSNEAVFTAPAGVVSADAGFSFATPAAAADDESALSEAELRARGFDPSERLTSRIADEIDPQLLPIFLEEAAELVPQLGQQLRVWSGQPGEARNAQALQRTLHTLKGSARMAGAMTIGQVTHSMETRIENAVGLPAIPPAIFDGLLSSYDRVSLLLEALRADPEGTAVVPAQGLRDDDIATVADAGAAAPPGGAVEIASVAPAVAPGPSTGILPRLPLGAPSGAMAMAPVPPLPGGNPEEAQRALLRVRADLVDRLVNEAGEVAIARSRIEGELRAVKANLKDLTESVTRLRGQLREIEIAAESQMQSRQREAEVNDTEFDPLEFDRFTRFQEITRMMAESVNDVATVQQSLVRNVDDADLALLAQARLNRDLQGDLMRVRMVPFNNVAERLYRVVRQTAKELRKRANLDIRGVQTEIDRSVLERMTGPFEHLLRNAIVHGLEEPAARAAAGKSDIGQIVLSARQEGNEFSLVLEDDGRGLDLERIRSRAVSAGLAREGDTLSDAQIVEFIFSPGFSTAEEISALAGRGVGMDVVRAEVAALGGRIDTEFTPGQGTRFSIALPLTLAVTQVVLVRAGPHIYAVPSVTVEQVRQTRAEDLAAAHAAHAVHWQERDYPLYYLPRLLGDAASAAQAQRFTPVLLMRSGTQRAAIHVDEMIGNQEVVVKNIGPQLARVTGIAGATVLGNGRIVLILNPVPLALQAQSTGIEGGPEAPRGPDGLSPEISALLPVAPTVMVVDDSLTVRKITSRLLARENYQVLTARDGVDALEQLQTARPDILLVDIEMPRMDGFDLTRNVRADAALKNLPIIMITSRAAEKHRKYAFEVGVDMFLGKPYQEEELLKNIAILVKRATAPA